MVVCCNVDRRELVNLRIAAGRLMVIVRLVRPSTYAGGMCEKGPDRSTVFMSLMVDADAKFK